MLLNHTTKVMDEKLLEKDDRNTLKLVRKGWKNVMTNGPTVRTCPRCGEKYIPTNTAPKCCIPCHFAQNPPEIKQISKPMEHISSFAKARNKRDRRNEVLEYFAGYLVNPWLSYKKLPRNAKTEKQFKRILAIKTSHLSIAELQGFAGECRQMVQRKGLSFNFSWYFWGKLKPKQNEKDQGIQ